MSLSKAILAFLGSVPFFVVSAWGPESFGLTPKPDWPLIRWPTLAFGAWGMAASAKNFFDDRIQLRVDDDGIYIRPRPEVIPWSEISGIRVVRYYPGRTFHTFYMRWIVFDLRDPSLFPSAPPYFRFISRTLSFIRVLRNLGDIVISSGRLDCTTDALLAAIEQHAPPGFNLSRDGKARPVAGRP
jgi:hypothetical protein